MLIILTQDCLFKIEFPCLEKFIICVFLHNATGIYGSNFSSIVIWIIILNIIWSILIFKIHFIFIFSYKSRLSLYFISILRFHFINVLPYGIVVTHTLLFVFCTVLPTLGFTVFIKFYFPNCV